MLPSAKPRARRETESAVALAHAEADKRLPRSPWPPTIPRWPICELRRALSCRKLKASPKRALPSLRPSSPAAAESQRAARNEAAAEARADAQKTAAELQREVDCLRAEAARQADAVKLAQASAAAAAKDELATRDAQIAQLRARLDAADSARELAIKRPNPMPSVRPMRCVRRFASKRARRAAQLARAVSQAEHERDEARAKLTSELAGARFA